MLIATPNLCIDRTTRVPRLVPGGVMRATEVTVTAGGKGVDVVRAASASGHRPTLVALVPHEDRDLLAGLLAAEAAEIVLVACPGRARVTMIVLEDGGRVTVVNERGEPIADQDWGAFAAAVERNLPGQRVVVCSGSLPPGAPLDGYGQLVAVAHERGVRVIMDTAPDFLRACLPSRPDLVCPNLEEAEATLGSGSADVLSSSDEDVEGRAMAAATALRERGARQAVVTAGSAGAAHAAAGQVTWVPTVPVTTVNTVGAGDAFVGGAAGALERFLEKDPSAEPDWSEVVLHGVATGSASCEQPLAGAVDPARVEELVAAVRAASRGAAVAAAGGAAR